MPVEIIGWELVAILALFMRVAVVMPNAIKLHAEAEQMKAEASLIWAKLELEKETAKGGAHAPDSPPASE
ncbi:hypothetical protein P12x_005338 [Tundrisphaera lichenicola]|uniref:hypothetical protein n=1 Tax=Tundrisphaera lichenicola TaxID=2029860 RepID=UPI003EBF68D5